MKMMKWALLGGAAFAVMSTSAQADELSALKAQLEALQSRVTELESQPATSVPSGYSLLSFREGQGKYVETTKQSDKINQDSGFTISVLPTADVAPAAEVSVSGELRTILFYTQDEHFEAFGIDPLTGPFVDSDTQKSEFDVTTRGRLVAQGKADTAVGEVGGRIRIQGGDLFDSSNTPIVMNQAYGWWKFAPNWQLLAGYIDTTAAIQAGVDWDFTFCGPSCGGPSDKINEQIQLMYTNGPFSFAIAVEDSDTSRTAVAPVVTTVDGAIIPDVNSSDSLWTVVAGTTAFGTDPDRGNLPAVVGYLMYNNESLMFQVAGVYQDDDQGEDQDWAVGAGARVGLGDLFTLTAAGVYAKGYNGYADTFNIANDDKFWAASLGVIFNVAEDSRIEAGAGYEDRNADGYDGDLTVWTGTVGLYWDPVSQVTLGLIGNYQYFNPEDVDDVLALGPIDGSGDNHDAWTISFGTWLRFP